MIPMLTRPANDECADYYRGYIDQVPPLDVLALHREQAATTERFLGGLPSSRHGHRYAPGKWSVREVVGHVIDVERAFGFRALCFARRDPAPLPSFEQDPYVAHARYDDRPMDAIVREYATVKHANAALFASFAEDEWDRRGTASGVEFTVRAIPFILTGHEIHHWRILRERYL